MNNPNLFRRPGRGLLLVLAYPALKTAAWLLAPRMPRRRVPAADKKITVYQSYQVGDFFMALPALRLLARHVQVTVVCRPDCLFLVRDLSESLSAEGREASLIGVGFSCPFFSTAGLGAFWKSVRDAWALRGRLQGEALDTDADPRTAFFLKVAGATATVSYRRPFGWLFDETFALLPGEGAPPHHQAEKNRAVAEGWLKLRGFAPAPAPAFDAPRPAVPATALAAPAPTSETTASAAPLHTSDTELILSCWTRRDEKNWPLDRWSQVIAFLLERDRRIAIIVPPDADQSFRDFRAQWESEREQAAKPGRVEFLSVDLEALYGRVRKADAVLCTDNFLGHMAAYLDIPVLWINGSSDPMAVAPWSARTRIVQLDPMPCRPCRHRCTNPVYKQCLLDLSAESVIPQIESWLSTRGAPLG